MDQPDLAEECRPQPGESGIDEIGRRHLARLDQQQPHRPEPDGEDQGEAVRRDLPGCLDALVSPDGGPRQPDAGRPIDDECCDLRLALDQPQPRLQRLEQQAVLLHGEDGHPVCRQIAEANGLLRRSDRIGERPAAGDDEVRARRFGDERSHRRSSGAVDQAAAQLDDRQPTSIGPGHGRRIAPMPPPPSRFCLHQRPGSWAW